ncbi:hypothetical protein SNE40_023527 [Patella caerulea]|uniref:Uncharacterized protein n=2 Tax=Patella caerulea TaxID=87958 RepID=A0AAN8FYP5_PATCE
MAVINQLWSLSSIILVSLITVNSLRFRGEPNTYAKFPVWNACINASISFEFKTTQSNGLFLYTDNNGRYDFFEVALKDGSVQLRLNVVDEQDGSVEIVLGNNLNDNRWHSVVVKRKHFETILQVDDTSSSKVAFGSDSGFGDRRKNNFVYFGGVPLGYARDSRRSPLDETVTDAKFEGDLRNILYFNCTCIPERASVLNYQGVSREPRETCEINNRCPADCPCVSVEGDSGCECKYKESCIAELYTRYHLPMDRLSGNGLINPSGMASTVHGNPQIVPGVVKQALELDGRVQYARIAGSSHRAECLGDLSKCPDGYFLSMWLQFKDHITERGVYMSNGGERQDSHGIAMYYGDGILEFIFKHPNGQTWSVKDRNFLPKRWYHVAASWDQNKGLHLFVDGNQVNHDNRPQRGSRVGRTAYNDFILGKSNSNDRTDRLGTMLVDDFRFISGFRNNKEVRESGPIFRYHMDMDNMQGNTMTFPHINAQVHGNARLTDEAVLNKALNLVGNGQYVDLGNFPGTCFGDLMKCQHGITLSFWVNFPRLDGDSRYLFSSPNGISVYYSGSRLHADAHMGDRNWAAYYTGIRTRQWYFVEISWNPELGLTMFVDEERVAFQPRDSHRGVSRRDHRILIGKEASASSLGETNTAIAMVDEVDVYYADREKLVDLGVIRRGRPVPYHFDFERMEGNRLVHDSILVNLEGNPRLRQGKIGKALELKRNRQVADFGRHNQICFGNLDYCRNGALFSFWIKPSQLKRNTYFASTGNNGITLHYKNRKLIAKAETSSRTWETSTPKLVVDKWQFVETSWHPETGLKLYINNEMVGEDTRHSQRDARNRGVADQDDFYLGRGNLDMNDNNYANAMYDELDFWYADRDYLAAHGYIQRGKPKHYIIDFEEIDGIRLIHESLPIRVVENAKIIPGKVGNALELNGNRQYVDISGRNGECLGNLALCWQGITISTWMRFRRFENNMVFLSTGKNGILVTYRDGYIYVTADGRSQVTVPALERNRWYYFEITWHPTHGLKVYVDQMIEGSAPSSPLRDATGTDRTGSFYIGRPNAGDTPGGLFAFGNFDIDEMEVWYGRREDLMAFGYIRKTRQDNFGHETFSFENAVGDKVDHVVYTVLLVNGARITRGLIGNAVLLDGRDQYVNLDEHPNKCMTELDLCTHGFTISLMLNPRTLRNGNYFLSSPAYDLYYQDRKLHAKFRSKNRSWTVSTDRLREDQWQHVTMSWHPIKGLSLYLDDVQVDSAYGTEEPLGDQPRSSTVYLGKNALSDRERATANAMVDEVQFWYDDLDHLKATGQYGAPINPQRVNFDLLRGGSLQVGNRRIVVYGGPSTIQGQRYRALFLNGLNQYVDLGQNFTCAGNLDNCRQGATIRFFVKPERLQDGMYFIDSYPLRVYYRDGKLFAEMQTATRQWDVSSGGFEAGKWQNVELSWHPTVGLGMYLNGRRVAHQTYPTIRAPIQNDDWRTYVGRPLVTGGDRRYANTYLENIEFYNTRRDYIPSAYRPIPLPDPTRPPPRTRPPPIRTPRPPIYRTRRPDPNVYVNGSYGEITTIRPAYTQGPSVVDTSDRRGTTKVIRFNGLSYLKYKFDYNTLPASYYERTEQEDLSFHFITDKPDGLLWFHQGEDGREMHLSLKGGKLVFVNDDDGSPKEITIAPDTGAGYDDWGWHRVNVNRRGRRINISVDGRNGRDYIFENDDIQLLTLADVWVGGTPNTYELTNGVVRRNFDGGVADMIYSTRDGNIITDVNLIGLSGSSHGNVDITDEWINPRPRPVTRGPIIITGRPQIRTPPPPRVTLAPVVGPTPVTFKESNTYITLPTLKIQEGGVIHFRFRTIKDNGLMLFNRGAANAPNFIAVELFDGKLYFVYDFGSFTRRVPFSPRVVSDGQEKEVEIRFFNRHIDLLLNGESKRINFVSGEVLRDALKGAFYVGGFDSFTSLPWHVWSREGYQGCFQDLRVNGKQINLHSLVSDQFLYGKVDRRCLSMPRECAVLQPCLNGFCQDTWNGYRCDCRGTSFTGRNCDKDALVGALNGKQFAVVSMDATQTHTNDISMRFKSPLSDALLFQTHTDVSNEYLRCELENGRIKITTNLGGETKSFYAGENLNDFQWHTVYINRRGNQIEVWVDDGEREVGELSGERFFFDIEQIFIGGLADDNVQIGGNAKNYIGYMQGFMFNDVSVFERAVKQPGDNLISFNLTDIDRLPPLIYNPITIKNRDTFVQLPTLRIPASMVINFMFKTKETSGVLLFNGGRNREFLSVELYNGYLHFAFNTSDSSPALRMNTPQPLNDNKWHTVTIRRVDNRRFSVSIDGISTTIASEGRDTNIDLQGPLYIGGLPQNMFDQDYVSGALLSKNGFQGCLASIDLSGAVPDLVKYGGGSTNIITGCTEIQAVCGPETCTNFGKCVPDGALFRCDCNMTSFVGTICNEEAIGFRLKETRTKDGILIYTYSQGFEPSSMTDDIAFGFMTNEPDGILMRVNSALVGDFIELRLENGHVIAEYDTDSSGKSSKIVQSSRRFNDGKYHVVRFYRTSNNATLRVDDIGARINSHSVRHGVFDKHGSIHIGGYRVNNAIQRPFNGIIAGMYFNGLRVMDMAANKRQTVWIGDVAIAPSPFSLSGSTIIIRTPKPDLPKVTVGPPVTLPPPVIPGKVPDGTGGGGIGGTGGGTVVSGGGGGSGILLGGGSAQPLAAASVGGVPTGGFVGGGPRAGAVVGTVLGILALASSMMWAFYLCKPGWCVRPAGAGGAPVAISPPRAGSNLGAVTAAGGMAGAGSIVGGSAAAGGAGAGGGGVNYDTATLRGTGTFTSSGTTIGTPKAGRAHLGSTASQGSAAYYQQNTSVVDGGNLGSPATLGSYHYEGHGMADYDLAHGMGGAGGGGSANYQSNTLQSGYSASTMTMYNYNMQNVRTVTGQHQMMGYGAQNMIPPTPGAMGEEVRVDCCLMTADGRSVVTGSSHGPPQCWDMQSGELLRTMKGYTMGSTNLHLACNDRMLVGAVNADLDINEYSVRKGVTNRQLQIWDFTNGQPLEMSSLIEYCSAVCVMSDNDKVVFARTDKFGNATAVVVWDILGNQPIKEMRYDSPVGNNDYVHYINLSQNDRFVIAGFTNTFDQFAEFVVFDMTLTSYNVMEPSFLRLDANPECTEVLPRDEAVTGLRNGDLVVWSLRTGQPNRQLVSPNGRAAHDREVKAVVRSKDNKYLVTASADGTLKCWDLETERQMTTMSGHQDEVWCCAISPDNEIVVSGSRDGTIRLWQLRNGKQICSFNAGVDVFYITMSQDKSTIVALGDKFGARKLIMLQVVRTKVRRQITTS